jgi:hypothetical protein
MKSFLAFGQAQGVFWVTIILFLNPLGGRTEKQKLP